MKVLLVRVGADQSEGGGKWNGPVDHETRKFVYVPIPESKHVLPGLEKPYASQQLQADLKRFGVMLPEHLRNRHMHLDPDFERCTYGDQGHRAKQLEKLNRGDMILFYAGLRAHDQAELVYALIGQVVVEQLVHAANIKDRDLNAHTRRDPIQLDDLVVVGNDAGSGRFARCIPIGEKRNKQYYVKSGLLEAWGGLTVKNGWLQRGGNPPTFENPDRFLKWLANQRPILLKQNSSE